ncbi:hypothetical protein DFS34DRAFT_616735 [Phlyctochytrium arcticum]|nr:hypothetical protein DFS34DRAFT_616735 [Phlyctochytrium arcticum]
MEPMDQDYFAGPRSSSYLPTSPPPSPPNNAPLRETRTADDSRDGYRYSDGMGMDGLSHARPISPPASPCSSSTSSWRCRRGSADSGARRSASPASLSLFAFEMDGVEPCDSINNQPSDPTETNTIRLWPTDLPTVCLLVICNYLSLSDLTTFSLSSKTLNASLDALRPTLLSQRLLQGRHLSRDLFAAFTSGESPYTGLLLHSELHGGRSGIYRLLRNDQRVVEAFVGALVTCVAKARSDVLCRLGRRVVSTGDARVAGPSARVWAETVARRDAVRALLLLWPVVDILRDVASQVGLLPAEGAITESMDITPQPPSQLADWATLKDISSTSLSPFDTETLLLAWTISSHVARQIIGRYQSVGWTAPIYHEGMIGPAILPGKESIMTILGTNDTQLVWEYIREFERTTSHFEGWCPVRSVLELELTRRGASPGPLLS